MSPSPSAIESLSMGVANRSRQRISRIGPQLSLQAQQISNHKLYLILGGGAGADKGELDRSG